MKVGIFNIRIVNQGDRYGLNNCLTHTGAEPMVEFYDTRYSHTEHGQFVSRYWASTIVDHDMNYGLALDLSVPGWTIHKEDMRQVVEFVRSHVSAQGV